MLFFVKEALMQAPEVAVFDLAAALPPPFRHGGPLLACVTYWTQEPDPTATDAAFQIDLDWNDPSGDVRHRPGKPVLLDRKDYFSTDFFMVRRFVGGDDVAHPPQLRLLFGVGAAPGAAKVGYSVLLGPAASGDLIVLP